MSTETGGQAFPKHYQAKEGMTLRDYFAAKIVAAWIVGAESLDGTNPEHRAELAKLAYEQADAMLKERAK